MAGFTHSGLEVWRLPGHALPCVHLLHVFSELPQITSDLEKQLDHDLVSSLFCLHLFLYNTRLEVWPVLEGSEKCLVVLSRVGPPSCLSSDVFVWRMQWWASGLREREVTRLCVCIKYRLWEGASSNIFISGS